MLGEEGSARLCYFLAQKFPGTKVVGTVFDGSQVCLWQTTPRKISTKVRSYWDSYEIKEKTAKADAEMAFSALFSIITSNDKAAVVYLWQSSAIFLLFWHSIRVVVLLCGSYDSSDRPESSRSQINVAPLLRINLCFLWFPRFWRPGHRSVSVRHKHM